MSRIGEGKKEEAILSDDLSLVGEAGLEPARPQWTLEPESSESTNSTTRPSLFSTRWAVAQRLDILAYDAKFVNNFFGKIKIFYAWQNRQSVLEYHGNQFNNFYSEWYPRGRRGSPAKGVGGQKPREGSNPSHSATEIQLRSFLNWIFCCFSGCFAGEMLGVWKWFFLFPLRFPL